MDSINSQYKSVFDLTPIPIWIEDFSSVKQYLESLDLIGESVDYIEAFILQQPRIVEEVIRRIRVVDFNSACLILHNAASPHELKSAFTELFLPETRELIKKQILAICQEKSYVEGESKMLTLDNQSKIIHVKWQVLEENLKDLFRVVVSTEDITNSVLKRRHQEDTEKKLRQAQQLAQLGYWELNIKTKKLYLSEGARSICEIREFSETYEIEAFIKNIHSEDRENYKIILNDSIHKSQEFECKYRIQFADGRIKWVKTKAEVSNDASGRGIFLKGTLQNITDEEELKTGLKELLKRYHMVTKATSEAIYDFDIETEQVIYGEGYHTSFGHKIDDLNGNLHFWKSNIHPADNTRVLQSLDDFLHSDQEKWKEIYRFRKADGSYAYVIDRALTLRREDGTAYRMVGAIYDITLSLTTEKQKELLNAISSGFNEKVSLEASITHAAKALIRHDFFDMVEIWTVSDQLSHMNLVSRELSDEKFNDFYVKSSSFDTLEKGKGLPGLSWENEKIIHWNKSEEKKLFLRYREAIEVGIETAYAVPINFYGTIIGSLVIFSREKIVPNQIFETHLEELGKFLSFEIQRKKQEIELNHLFNIVPDIIAVIGNDGLIKKINGAVEEITGFSTTHFLGKPYQMIIYAEDRASSLEQIKKLFQEESNANFENRVFTIDGELKWFSWTGKVLADKKYLYLVAKDITEKKKLDLLFDKATNMAKIGYWEADFEKDKMLWSGVIHTIHEIEDYLELKPADVIDFYKGGPDREAIKEATKNAIKHGESWDLELRIVTKKGNERWIRVQGQPEFLNGKCIRLFGSFQDIHEKKLAEEELLKRTQFISTTLDNLPIGIAVNNIGSGMSTLMNKRFVEIYGWDRDDILDIESFFEKVYPDPIYRKKISTQIMADIQSGDPERMVWSGIKITTKKGEKKIINAKNIPLVEQNLMISTVIDDTVRHRAEEALLKSNERFTLATKAVSDAIWDWDVENGTIYWGNGYKTLFGYPLDNHHVTESARQECIHRDDYERINQSFKATRENPEENKWTGEYRFRKFDGSYTHVREQTVILRHPLGHAVRMVGAIQDITEQKLAEEKLYNERNLLRSLIDNIPDYIFVKDTELRHIINNKANVSLLGAGSEEETLGKTAADYFSKGIADAFIEDDLKVINTQETIINREEPVYTTEGDIKWLSTTKIPLRDNAGKIMGLLGISRDITESKSHEEQLNLLKSVIEQTSDGVVVTDPFDSEKEVKIQYTNKAFAEMVGYEQEELVGQNHGILTGPKSELAVLENLRASMKNNLTAESEFISYKKNKDEFWLNFRMNPLKDARGKITHWIIITRDVTERKRKEQVLIKRAKLLETIAVVVELLLNNDNWKDVLVDTLELMSSAVQTDRATYFEVKESEEDGLLYASQYLEWVSGEEYTLKKTFKHHKFTVNDYPLIFHSTKEKRPFFLLKSEMLETKENAFLTQRKCDSMIILPIYQTNQIAGYILFESCQEEKKWTEEETSFLQTLISNLSATLERQSYVESLKSLNNQLNETNYNLEISNKELEQFAYIASHDLQEPLRMISSFLTQIEKKYAEQLDDRGKKYIFYAVDGAKRMRTIILDLLEYSRAGRDKGELENVDLNECVDEVCKLLDNTIHEKKAKINYEELPSVRGPKSQLRQIIQNLISNALKYQHPENTPIINLSVTDKQAFWEIAIQDNGIGIETQHTEKIFIIFQRLHGKEEYSGTGIGLAVCKKIVENWGGRIWVESNLGQGVTFYFTLPK